MADWYENLIKKLGYKGCKNCIHQIEPLRTCEWMERGGDKAVHLVCPKWEKNQEEIDED